MNFPDERRLQVEAYVCLIEATTGSSGIFPSGRAADRLAVRLVEAGLASFDDNHDRMTMFAITGYPGGKYSTMSAMKNWVTAAKMMLARYQRQLA